MSSYCVFPCIDAERHLEFRGVGNDVVSRLNVNIYLLISLVQIQIQYFSKSIKTEKSKLRILRKPAIIEFNFFHLVWKGFYICQKYNVFLLKRNKQAQTIYAFSRRFYPKRLTVHSGYTFFVSMCSLGIEPTTFCAANAMLYHWATGSPDEKK